MEKSALYPRIVPLLIFSALRLAGQTAHAMPLEQTRYELKMGQPVPLAAPSETLDFLRTAKSRSIQIEGAKADGLVIGQDRSGRMVLAASPRAKTGEYSVTLSAISATGEQRQAVVALAVAAPDAVPTGSTRNPVVLLNGWEEGFTGSCPISSSSSDTFGNLASYLVSDGVPDVYLFDNCLVDPNQLVETLGNDLGTFLNSIKYTNGQQVPQIDLVAFSLGGLIVRAYLSGLQSDGALTPPFPTLVGNVVLIASPNFGSFVAGNYAIAITAGTQDAELIPGSALLWNLATWNQYSDDMRGTNAVAVVGNAGTYTSSLEATTALNNASDGIVSTTSASVGFVTEQAGVTRIVPYCDVDPSAYTNTSFGTFACDAPGIANVTSTSQETGEIVRSFLGGTSAWMSIGTSPTTDPFLSMDGGWVFAFVSPAGSYASDVTQVVWGTLDLTDGGDTNTIYYQDFVSGTGVFEVTSTSLGTWGCGSWTAPVSYFSALRCKLDPNITSIGPPLSTFPKVVTAGVTITITGADFGSKCSNCTVTALLAGATTAQALQIGSWSSTQITAALPASYIGLVTITVNASTGTDSIAIIAALSSTTSTIAVSPTSLQFSYTSGGAAPAAQSIQITNSGSGTLAWTATASASWLSVASASGGASGTAPSTVSVSVSPSGLSAGTYTGSVQISASGASNTPLSVAVTFTVTAPSSLMVAPTGLSFNYSVGSAAPAAQTVSISNTGGGTLTWTASTTAYWIALTPASGTAPGTLSVSMNPANLAAGTYTGTVQITAAGATGSPASVTLTLVVQGTQPAPSISAVTNAASFQSGAASATWISIFGTNLSTTTYTWQDSDFVNGMLPTSLEGISATINGVSAFVEYISPSQINVLAPDDSTTGSVQVQLTVAQQASNSLTVQKTQFFRAFFTIDNGLYVAAQHANFELVASSGLLPGVTSSPAQPGETILLYGTGFGPTTPAVPTSGLVTTPEPLANSVQVTIGGTAASVVFAGLIGPGLYQLNVTVPTSLPSGDAPVVATIQGISTQTGVSITVQ
ncbi:MAG TPA: IPT/TIG domain-containing protein [Bryobacteraceae bacterium]